MCAKREGELLPMARCLRACPFRVDDVISQELIPETGVSVLPSRPRRRREFRFWRRFILRSRSSRK